MAYHLYNTEALVCGSRDSNTSDRAYILFTREAGMIWAQTKSAREERSKHRYALQDFSVIRVSLVYGKAGWRIVGSEPIANLYYTAKERGVRILLRNVVRLLRRVIRGEEATPELYDDLMDILKQLPTAVVCDELETVLTLRILQSLGYVAPKESYQSLLEGSARDAYETRTKGNLASASRAIEGALLASHL